MGIRRASAGLAYLHALLRDGRHPGDGRPERRQRLAIRHRVPGQGRSRAGRWQNLPNQPAARRAGEGLL
eukprot:5250485-Pyramimonas_sp.AAC.1